MKLSELQRLLNQKLVIVPGLRDISDNYIVFINLPANAKIESTDMIDSLKKAMYFVISIYSGQTSSTLLNRPVRFVIVFDIRKMKFTFTKRSLKLLDEHFHQYIVCVFLIRSDSFWQVQWLTLTNDKYRFEVCPHTVDSLLKVFDHALILQEFGGSCNFNYGNWAQTRMNIRSLLCALEDHLSKMAKFNVTVLASNLHQDHLLMSDLDTLIGLLRSHSDVDRRHALTIVKSLEAIYRQASYLNDIACPQEKQQLLNCMKRAVGARQKCVARWHERGVRLERAVRLKYFQRDGEKLLDWIEHNQQIILINMDQIGQKTSCSQELLSSHEQFVKSCLLSSDSPHSIECLRDVCYQLKSVVPDIVKKFSQLEQAWSQFGLLLKRRSDILMCAVHFHRSMNEFLDHVYEWNALLNSPISDLECENNDDSVNALKKIISSHQQLLLRANFAYSKLCKLGKSIIELTNKNDLHCCPPNGYGQITRHILNTIQDLLPTQKNLEETWSKRKQVIQSKLQRAVYKADSQAVVTWLENCGETYMQQNMGSIGFSVGKARSLLTKHEQFESKVSRSLANTEKLIQIGNGFNDFESDSTYRAHSQTLKVTIDNFIARVKQRKRVLNFSLLFHLHFKELSNWLSQMDEEINGTDNGNEDSTNSVRQIDCKLVELSTDMESLSSACEKFYSEGEYLLKFVSTLPSSFDTFRDEIRNHIEEMIKTIREKKSTISKNCSDKRRSLEFMLNLKTFETDVNDLSQQVTDVSTFDDRILGLTHEVIQRGKDMLKILDEESVSINIKDKSAINKKISEIISFVEKRNSVFTEYAEEQRRRLATRAEFHRLNYNNSKILQFIDEVDHRLQNSFKIAYCANEADLNSSVHQSIIAQAQEISVMLNVLTRRISMMKRHCTLATLNADADNMLAESTKHWHKLLIRIDTRHRLVNSQLSFFATLRQTICSLNQFYLELVAINNKQWLSNGFSAELEVTLHNLLDWIDTRKLSCLKACTNLKRCSESLIKHSQKSIIAHEKPQRLLITLKEYISEKLKDANESETSLQMKCTEVKKFIDETLQFILFKNGAERLLNWISCQMKTIEDQNEFDKSLKCDQNSDGFGHDFVIALKEKRSNVQSFVRSASNLADIGHKYANDIHNLCLRVEQQFGNFVDNVEAQLNLDESYVCDIKKDVPIAPVSLLSSDSQCNLIDLPNLTSDDKGNRTSRRRCEYIIEELIKTEESYVSDLKCCIEVYLTAFRTLAWTGCPKVYEQNIFSNIEDIYEFHDSIFLKELRKFSDRPENIGHCFITWADKFNIYVKYCMNKEVSNSILLEHDVYKFFEAVHSNCAVNVDPIGSYLIKPVQRITKYQLLLKDLSESCKNENDEELNEALEAMLAVPRKANDAIHLNYLECSIEADNFTREDLGELIYQDIIHTSDTKAFMKKDKERRVFLFNACLLITKEIQDSKGGRRKYVIKNKFLTAELGITEHIEGDSCRFAVWTGRVPLIENKIILKCSSMESKQTWVKKIRSVVQDRFVLTDTNRTGSLPFQNTSAVFTSDDSTDPTVKQRIHERTTPNIIVQFNNEQMSNVQSFYTSTDSDKINSASLTGGQRTGLRKWLKSPSRRLSFRDSLNNSARQMKVASVCYIISNNAEDTSKRGGDRDALDIQKGNEINLQAKRASSYTNISYSQPKSTYFELELLPKVHQQNQQQRNRSCSENVIADCKSDDFNNWKTDDQLILMNNLQTSMKSISLKSCSNESISSESTRQIKLQSGIQELIDTEQNYVLSLKYLVEKFADSPELICPSSVEDAQTKQRYIFGNIRQIYDFHSMHILPELISADSNLSSIAAIFTEKRFLIYIKYYENQSRARQFLSEFKNQFDELRRKSGLREDITSLLILPTQRLPRYRLLLQALKKYSDDHTSSNDLQLAIDSLDRVVNQAQMFIYLNRLINFNEVGGVISLGQLLKHGPLYVSITSRQLNIGKFSHSVSSNVGNSQLQNKVPLRSVKWKQKQQKFKSCAHSKSGSTSDEHISAGTVQKLFAFLFTQAIMFSSREEVLNKFEDPQFSYQFHIKLNKVSLNDFVNPPANFVDLFTDDDCEHLQVTDKSILKRAFLLSEVYPGSGSRRVACLCESVDDYNEWYRIIFEQLQSQNDFISALTNPTSTIKTQRPGLITSKSAEESNLTSQRRKSNSKPFVLPDEAVVLYTYTALADDEISVEQGDRLQILAANKQLRLFVNRPATHESPAAEGWIPGYTVGLSSDQFQSCL